MADPSINGRRASRSSIGTRWLELYGCHAYGHIGDGIALTGLDAKIEGRKPC